MNLERLLVSFLGEDPVARGSDLAQERRKQRQATHRVGRELRDVAEQAARLERDLERMSLLAAALAHVCIEHGLLSAAQLRAKMDALDVEDGLADGRRAPDPDEFRPA